MNREFPQKILTSLIVILGVIFWVAILWDVHIWSKNAGPCLETDVECLGVLP
jgi:hypothetical protein